MAISIDGSNNTIAGLAVGGLPDGIVDTDMIANSNVTSGKLASGLASQGITEVDEWRINTSSSTSGTSTLSANWERNDSNFELIGTGLSESSGVFTFPSTGKYYISFKTTAYGSSSTQYAGVEIMVSNDGSSYVNYAESFDSIEGSSNYYSSSGIELVLDVTNTSNFKFYFRMSSNQTVTFYGHTQRMATGFTCIRLGDT